MKDEIIIEIEGAAPAASAPAASAPAAPLAGSTITRISATSREARAYLDVALDKARSIYRTGGSIESVMAAMTDVITTGNETAFPSTPLTELWTPRLTESGFAQAVSTQLSLTEWNTTGWQWTATPQMADYGGDKTEIASPAVSVSPYTATPQRLAAAYNIDRAHMDFNSALSRSFWQALVDSNGYQLQQKVANAFAVPFNGTASIVSTSISEAVAKAAAAQADIGANVDYILLSQDLWAQVASMPVNELPVWARGLTFNLSKGTTQVTEPNTGSIPIVRFTGSGITGKLIVGDRRWMDLWTTPMMRADAVNVGLSGLDVGAITYYLIHTGASTGGGVTLAQVTAS